VFVDCYQDLSFLKEIKHQLSSEVCIIAIIANCLEHKIQAFELGAQDYVTHPMIRAELLVRLESAIALIKLKQFNAMRDPNKDVFSKETSKYAALVDKTCQFLMDNLAKTYSLNQLASLMLSNRNTLSRAFKQELGISVFAWLRLQRMEYAKKLLEKTGYSIQEISALVGYGEPANFATTFRSIYNISPSKYRQLCFKKKLE